MPAERSLLQDCEPGGSQSSFAGAVTKGVGVIYRAATVSVVFQALRYRGVPYEDALRIASRSAGISRSAVVRLLRDAREITQMLSSNCCAHDPVVDGRFIQRAVRDVSMAGRTKTSDPPDVAAPEGLAPAGKQSAY